MICDDNGDFNWAVSRSMTTSLIKTKRYLCSHFSCSSCPAYMNEEETCSLEEVVDVIPC